MSLYTFQADTSALKGHCKRIYANMQRARSPYESQWLEIRKQICPQIGKGLEGGEAALRGTDKDDGLILNSEPRILHGRLAAGLQSGITNQTQKWFALAVQEALTWLKARQDVQRWLADTTSAIADAMANSNCYAALDNLYLQLAAFGSGCMLVYDAEQGPHCEVCDAGDYWLAENRQGRVDRVVRRVWLTAQQMVDEFGAGWVGENLARQAEQGQQRQYEVFNLVAPHDPEQELLRDVHGDQRYVSVYWSAAGRENDGILAVRGFGHNPIVAPRWAVNGAVYGYGPGQIALPDAKQLQRLERDKLTIVGNDALPPLYAPASMRSEPALDAYPGGVVFGRDNDPALQGRGVQRLYESRPNLPAIANLITEIEGRLSRIFYADLFAMLLQLNTRPKQMTAREVSELNQEKVALLGPILTRLNTDLLDPLVTAYFDILARRPDGLPEIPQELVGNEVSIRYISSLHIEQQLTSKVRSVTSVLEVVGLVAQIKPEAIDKLDADEAVDVATSALPEASAIVLDKRKVAELRQARAEAQAAAERQQQMMRMAEAAPQVAGAARDLSETRVKDGSALAQIIENETGGVM